MKLCRFPEIDAGGDNHIKEINPGLKGKYHVCLYNIKVKQNFLGEWRRLKEGRCGLNENDLIGSCI